MYYIYICTNAQKTRAIMTYLIFYVDIAW